MQRDFYTLSKANYLQNEKIFCFPFLRIIPKTFLSWGGGNYLKVNFIKSRSQKGSKHFDLKLLVVVVLLIGAFVVFVSPVQSITGLVTFPTIVQKAECNTFQVYGAGARNGTEFCKNRGFNTCATVFEKVTDYGYNTTTDVLCTGDAAFVDTYILPQSCNQKINGTSVRPRVCNYSTPYSRFNIERISETTAVSCCKVRA